MTTENTEGHEVHVASPRDEMPWCGAMSNATVVPVRDATCFACWVYGYGEADAKRYYADRYGTEARDRALTTWKPCLTCRGMRSVPYLDDKGKKRRRDCSACSGGRDRG